MAGSGNPLTYGQPRQELRRARSPPVSHQLPDVSRPRSTRYIPPCHIRCHGSPISLRRNHSEVVEGITEEAADMVVDEAVGAEVAEGAVEEGEGGKR